MEKCIDFRKYVRFEEEIELFLDFYYYELHEFLKSSEIKGLYLPLNAYNISYI